MDGAQVSGGCFEKQKPPPLPKMKHYAFGN